MLYSVAFSFPLISRITSQYQRHLLVKQIWSIHFLASHFAARCSTRMSKCPDLIWVLESLFMLLSSIVVQTKSPLIVRRKISIWPQTVESRATLWVTESPSRKALPKEMSMLLARDPCTFRWTRFLPKNILPGVSNKKGPSIHNVFQNNDMKSWMCCFSAARTLGIIGAGFVLCCGDGHTGDCGTSWTQPSASHSHEYF